MGLRWTMLGLRGRELILPPGHLGGLQGDIGVGGGKVNQVIGGRVQSQRRVHVPGNQRCQCA